MASLAMTTTEWVNVSAMEWEDAPANMLHRSGGLLCTAWGCRKKTLLKCWICIKNVPAFFFYYIFWSFWNRWILKWQTNNSKFNSFSVGSSKAFSLWQVGKKGNDARFYSSLCMFFLSDVIFQMPGLGEEVLSQTSDLSNWMQKGFFRENKYLRFWRFR